MARTIPRGWQELEIKDFLRFTSREIEKPKDKYRSLGIRSHCKGTFVREVENPEKVMMETLYAVKKDDFIVNITFAWEGAVALVNKSDEGALVSHRFPTHVFDRKVVIPEFFRYLIPSKRFVYNLGVISPGGAGRNRVLDRKDFLRLQFITPSIEEQKKIAEILSTWDRAIETLGKLIDAKTKFKKGLMKKLLTGEARFKEFKGQWVEKKLEDLGRVVSGGTPDTRNPLYWDGDINWCTPTDITGLRGRKYLGETTRKITDSGFKNSSATRLPKNSVVVCTRATIGACAINIEEMTTNQGFKSIVPDGVDQEFLYYLILSKKHLLERLGNGSTFLEVSKTDFENIEATIPVDEKERKKIGQVLACMDRQIEIISGRLNLLKDQKKSLMQKLLTGKIRVHPVRDKK